MLAVATSAVNLLVGLIDVIVELIHAPSVKDCTVPFVAIVHDESEKRERVTDDDVAVTNWEVPFPVRMQLLSISTTTLSVLWQDVSL